MLRTCANLGPKSEAMLMRAGIADIDRLQQLGAVGAYLEVKRHGDKPSLHLLWALEGALTSRPWQEVAKKDRLRLLLELEALDADYFSSEQSNP